MTADPSTSVVGELEGPDDPDAVVVIETDNDQSAHRQQQEDNQDERGGLQKGNQLIRTMRLPRFVHRLERMRGVASPKLNGQAR